MSYSYLKHYSSNLKKNLKKISGLTARDFLFKNGYAISSFTMPDYYRPTFRKSINLDKIGWSSFSIPQISKTLDVITPKGNMSWRSFNFLNPYIFFHIVKEITDKENWKIIKELLAKETLVYSYSTPSFNAKNRKDTKAKAILSWIQMAEKDLLKDCAEFHYLTVTDIKNFYPTIYTHSIAWAIHKKARMKNYKNRKNFKLLGNRLDKLFQNARDGQTNGIPVGSMVSDIIAEVLLIDIDEKLSALVKKDRLEKNIIVCRYRDDYRILSKTADQGRKVLQHLNKILYTEYNLLLNEDKTNTYNDVLENLFRPWIFELNNSHLLRKIKYGDVSECNSANFLRDCLLETYRIQKRFSHGASFTILTNLAEELDRNLDEIEFSYSEIPEIVSILRKITLVKEEVTPQAFLLLDILMGKIKTKSEKEKLLDAIKNVITGKSDNDYQMIWFYRLCWSQLPEMCKKILKESNVSLLRILDSRYYANDFEIFEPIDISDNDKEELKKFSFINRKLLEQSESKPISPKSINIFRY